MGNHIHMDATTRRKVMRGDVVTKSEKVAGSTMPRLRVIARIDKPLQRVWDMVTTTEVQARYMPRIKLAEILERFDDGKTVRTVVDMPFPFKNLESVTRCYPKDLSDGGKTQSWRLLSGDFDTNEGSWTMEPLDGSDQATLIQYEFHAEPHIIIPNKIQALAQTVIMPKLIKVLRDNA